MAESATLNCSHNFQKILKTSQTYKKCLKNLTNWSITTLSMRLAQRKLLIQVGLYKVEFRILEIRISGETNLKKHFLSGNWIRKKFFGRKKRLNFGRRFTLNFGEDLFFFFFWRSSNFGRKKLYCHSLP